MEKTFKETFEFLSRARSLIYLFQKLNQVLIIFFTLQRHLLKKVATMLKNNVLEAVHFCTFLAFRNRAPAKLIVHRSEQVTIKRCYAWWVSWASQNFPFAYQKCILYSICNVMAIFIHFGSFWLHVKVWRPSIQQILLNGRSLLKPKSIIGTWGRRIIKIF